MKARLVLTRRSPPPRSPSSLAGCGGERRAPAPTRPRWRRRTSPLFVEATLQPEGELKANIEALAKSIAGDRRPRRPDRRRARKLGQRLRRRRSTSRRKSSRGWAKRPASSSRSYDGEDFQRLRRRGPDAPTPTPPRTSSTSRSQAGDDADRGRLLRRRRLQGRKRRRDHDRRDRRLPRLRRRRADLQGDGRRLRRRIAGRRGRLLRDAIDAASDDSLADVYVDIGGLIDQSGGTIDPEAQAVPRQRRDRPRGSDRGGQPGPRLRPGRDRLQHRPRRREPADRRRLGAARLAARPTPSPPSPSPTSASRFERSDRPDRRTTASPARSRRASSRAASKEAGIDLDKIAGSIGDLGVFAEGSSESSLAGAVVLTTEGREGSDQHRRQHRPAAARHRHRRASPRSPARSSGFSIRSAGPRRRSRWSSPPRATGSRSPTACRRRPRRWPRGSGRDPRRQRRPTRKPSAPSATRRSAASSTARRRCSSPRVADRRPTNEDGFDEAKPYLDKIAYLAIGSGSSGDLATAKLIAGLGK